MSIELCTPPYWEKALPIYSIVVSALIAHAHGSPLTASRNFRELTFVILPEFQRRRILASPTTEPGRRG